MPKFPKNKGYKSPVKHHGMSVDSRKVKAGHYHDPKKGIVTVKKSTPAKHFGGSHKNNPEAVVSPGDPKVFAKWGRHSHAASEGKPSKKDKSATEYAPFKMKSPIKDKSTDEHPHVHLKREIKVRKSGGEIKVRQSERVAQYAPFKMKHAKGNPMKANFPSAFKGHMHTDNLPDGRSRSAAFQMHDGKKFEDAGFMDTHFPSGKARTPAKQLDGKESKIVKRMKKIEAKLAKNGSLSAEKKKKLKDELLKLSTTSEGQRYTDTGGIERSPTKQLGDTKPRTKTKSRAARKANRKAFKPEMLKGGIVINRNPENIRKAKEKLLDIKKPTKPTTTTKRAQGVIKRPKSIPSRMKPAKGRI